VRSAPAGTSQGSGCAGWAGCAGYGAVTITVTGPGSVRAAGKRLCSTCGMTCRGEHLFTRRLRRTRALASRLVGCLHGTGACDFVAAGTLPWVPRLPTSAAQRVKLLSTYQVQAG